jgi:predicted PurR-regulated permease PerM
MTVVADGLSGGEVVGLAFAVITAVLVGFIAFVLVKLGTAVGEASKLVQGVTDQTVPLLGEVTTSVTHVNVELERIDAITANVQTISSNASALSSVFAATLGSPVIKVAAFSYGVRRALNERHEADIKKRVKNEMKAEKKARKASK